VRRLSCRAEGGLQLAAAIALWSGVAIAVPPAVSAEASRPDAPLLIVQARTVSVDTSYGCLVCHADKRRDFAEGIHSEGGILCHDCHGGDPSSVETTAAGHARPFLGIPDALETVELCGSCHSDPDQMRPYVLPVDQIAEYRTSRHGQLLFRGDPNAPTCTDCHSSHTIRPPDDIRSDVHPTNIMPTCARCHEDEAMMSPYGIGTDQVTEFRLGAHGVGLHEEQNFSNPTCVSCHGSHSALPSDGLAAVKMCSRCHGLVGREFEQGPHGAAVLTGELDGCMGCHTHHGTQRVALEEVSVLCLECHEAESEAAAMGEVVQAELVRAHDGLEWAGEAVDELRTAGWETTDTRFDYLTALTYFRRMAPLQHGLRVEALEDLGRRVRSISVNVRNRAEVAEEHRWEHKLFLLPIWFLALSAVFLAWLRLREARR